MSIEHHPVADLFPMLPDDELKDLASDIAERGLLQPIVLDTDGRILDGRNRYAACELASVDPQFQTYDGDDPDGYALAVNIARRHLTKGQQAMVIARTVSETETRLSREDRQQLTRKYDISTGRLGQAAVVVKHAPDLADQVILGPESQWTLDKAYEEAKKRKREFEARDARMAKLRREAPDLADQVADEQITLAEAEQQHEAAINNARSAARSLDRDIKELEAVAQRLRTTQLDGRLALAFANGEKAIHSHEVTAIAPDLEKTISTLGDIADHLEGINGNA